MKQTAIDWLVDQIKSDQNQKALSASEWMQVIEQAKEIERKQIIKACDSNFTYGDYGYPTMGEQYYNETYGK